MAFRIGQKVVCVDDSPGFATGESCPLKRGAIYVLAEKSPHWEAYSVEGGDYRRWDATRFRPLTERSTEAGMSTLKRVAREASRSRENV